MSQSTGNSMASSSNPPMGGTSGNNNNFLRDPSGQQGFAPPSPYGTQQQQQQQFQTPQGNMYAGNRPSGSITQYATPMMQQQSSPYNFTPPPQQVQNSPYNFHPPPQPPMQQHQQQQQQEPVNTAGMSFAQRSAMMQQQQQQPTSGQGFAGNYPQPPQIQQQQQQQQQQQGPPVSQIHVPNKSSNTYGGEAPAPGSYAQRYQAIQQQQPSPVGVNQSGVYSTVPAGSDNLYPPSPRRQAQPPTNGMPQPPQAAAPGSFAQRQAAMMAGQSVPQQQAPNVAPGSFAQRQAAMMGQAQTSQGPQQQQQQQQFQQQQQQYQQPSGQAQIPQQQQPAQPPAPVPGTKNPNARPMLVDPPEVVAQQQRLLTEATRKVQEHAYYMKQAMERRDLPTVLDRAASMVGELGEHAHSHHHHRVHPPAPGATGTSTALQPKNYYELHLRALEELPTLENYLLDIATASKPAVSQPPSGAAPNAAPPPSQQQSTMASPPLQSTPNDAASVLLGQLTGDPVSAGVPAPSPANYYEPSNMNPLGPPGPVAYNNVPIPSNRNPSFRNQGIPNGGMMPVVQQPNPPEEVSYTMKELYDCVQYCPNVLSRLYLQICAASALIRSGEVGARWVFKDLIEAVKCVQNPVRGLFLRHYLLQAFRDKLPDVGIPVDQIGSLITGSTTPAAPTGESTIPLENVSVPAPLTSSLVEDPSEPGTVKDSYEFVLANFIEMNKLWVRIQHLPGDQRTKEVRRRREKDRNELRILVGTNLVRLSALDSITSTIYGQVILPTVLDQIVICADPLSQAYMLDCIVQVFPDEYHIETMPILLGVCPKLRDKVNIRTILISLMTRLANYLADEELLDEKDSNQVKKAVALDSFRMFNECVQNVYNARGPKLNAKEVIRLQTALLEFSMKCYKGNREQITLCLKNCVVALQQARDNAAFLMPPPPQPQPSVYGQPPAPLQAPPPPPGALEPVATKELEKLLSIPQEELALGVLQLDHYADLIAFLPWSNRREVGLTLLKSAIQAGKPPASVKEIEELFSVIAPLLRGEHETSASPEVDRTANLMAGLGVSYGGMPAPQESMVDPAQVAQDSAMVSKFLGMLDHEDTDVLFEMLVAAQNNMNEGKTSSQRASTAHVALVFRSLQLARRIDKEMKAPALETKIEETPTVEDAAEESEALRNEKDEEEKEPEAVEETKPLATTEEVPKVEKVVTCRKVFVFVQETIAYLAQTSPERGIKLYLEAALTADKLGVDAETKDTYGSIANELLGQSCALYEERIVSDGQLQRECVMALIGTLMACRSIAKEDYEGLIMNVSKFAAKVVKKSEQCEMVTMCSHLFYVVEDDGKTVAYSNPQRCLECLQRALKLANACTTTDISNLGLFVELLDVYLYFFEKKNPSITGNYITGLVALIKEHSNSIGQYGGKAAEAKEHFLQTVRYIKEQKKAAESSEAFQGIDVSAVPT